ncbi:MAG TPA: hypothetical protein VME40_15305 [Caulobacteraceae bacterium]|nr:hypothetical protein [Caulobacteraceae bacterium]
MMERRLDRSIALALAAVASSGCVSQRMEQGLGRLVGQNVQVAVQRFGYPQTRLPGSTGTVYTWKVVAVRRDPSPVGTFSGSVGSAPVYDTASGPPSGVVRGCMLRLTVDASQTIRGGTWKGDVLDCAAFAQSMPR